jgi:hypothetical protein
MESISLVMSPPMSMENANRKVKQISKQKSKSKSRSRSHKKKHVSKSKKQQSRSHVKSKSRSHVPVHKSVSSQHSPNKSKSASNKPKQKHKQKKKKPKKQKSLKKKLVKSMSKVKSAKSVNSVKSVKSHQNSPTKKGPGRPKKQQDPQRARPISEGRNRLSYCTKEVFDMFKAPVEIVVNKIKSNKLSKDDVKTFRSSRKNVGYVLFNIANMRAINKGITDDVSNIRRLLDEMHIHPDEVKMYVNPASPEEKEKKATLQEKLKEKHGVILGFPKFQKGDKFYDDIKKCIARLTDKKK